MRSSYPHVSPTRKKPLSGRACEDGFKKPVLGFQTTSDTISEN